MHLIKACISFLILSTLIPGCISPFDPEIREQNISKYVVSGQITDKRELQTVTISRASSVDDPRFTPIPGCLVRITDDRGNVFLLNESAPGIYSALIDSSFLIAGASFKVEVSVPDGTYIESDFDRMNECPDVGPVNYVRKEIVLPDGQITKGIRFYLDVEGGNTDNRFYRWELYETWEYHASYPREWYYDGISVKHIDPADYSRIVCWSTELIKNTYTLSTKNLVENRYEKYPLHFVSNRTSRLRYGYSLLISQYSLSEAAYSYWEQLRINSIEQGGLYQKQPFSVTGNLHNVTDPEQKVLGFFSASSVKSKRIFIRRVENLELDFETYCSPSILRKGLMELGPEDFPAFLMGDERGYNLILLGNECVDCLTLGGTNIKPAFWPNYTEK